VRLADPLAARPATLAAQRLRAGAELDAARGNWAAVAAAMAPAAEGAAPPYWALGLRGWALHQQGHLEASRMSGTASNCYCPRLVYQTPGSEVIVLAASSPTAEFGASSVQYNCIKVCHGKSRMSYLHPCAQYTPALCRPLRAADEGVCFACFPPNTMIKRANPIEMKCRRPGSCWKPRWLPLRRRGRLPPTTRLPSCSCAWAPSTGALADAPGPDHRWDLCMLP
jgi:hypothetical protein